MPIIINLDVVMARRKIGAGELAEKVGITDDSYFSRLFKRYIGISPSKLQRMANR